jgi:hypothetical protein
MKYSTVGTIRKPQTKARDKPQTRREKDKVWHASASKTPNSSNEMSNPHLLKSLVLLLACLPSLQLMTRSRRTPARLFPLLRLVGPLLLHLLHTHLMPIRLDSLLGVARQLGLPLALCPLLHGIVLVVLDLRMAVWDVLVSVC